MHLPLPRKARKDFAELITVMLHKDPRKRPTSVEIFERLEDIAGILDTERAYEQISSYLHINRTTKEYIYKVLSVNASHESTISVVTSKENVYDHKS
jgi:serine/threonine protein kinase